MAILRTLLLSIVCFMGAFEAPVMHAAVPVEIGLESQAQLYHSQDRHLLGTSIKAAIDNAKESVLIFTFSLSDADVLRAIGKKVQEGIPVTVVIDREHTESIRNVPGVEIVTRMTGEGHLHHKILVVDQREIWIGSANFTTSAYVSQENLMVRFVSPELGDYLHHEADVFRGRGSRIEHGPLAINLKNQTIYFGLLPHDGFPQKKVEKAINDHSKKFLIEKIDQAQSNIKIAMMVWTNNDLTKAVIEAKKRGVTVQVVAPDFEGSLPTLIAAGIEVRVNPALSFMHNKLMCVDDYILVNGSANWSQSSFTRSDESFVVIDPMTPDQSALFADYWHYLFGR